MRFLRAMPRLFFNCFSTVFPAFFIRPDRYIPLMRRLLLLVMVFLLPLQWMAATAGDLSSRVTDAAVAPGHVCMAGDQAAELMVTLPLAAQDGTGMHTDDDASASGEEEPDLSTAQPDVEDHTLPVPIATPRARWQSFPHAFAAPLAWSSFLRDQLRPPPLA